MTNRVATGLVAIGLVVAGCAVTGCGDVNAIPSSRLKEEWSGLNLTLLIDPAMRTEDQELVKNDILHLKNLQLAAVAGSVFETAFGGTNQGAVLRYIDERVNYLVPNIANIGTRVSSEDYTTIMASNIGTALWLNGMAHDDRDLRFEIDGSEVTIDSSRVGLIMLGDGYSRRFEPLDRIGTLVHEARHSDCTGGLPEADRDRVRRGELPGNLACGHLHVDCPPGHDYEGIPACDRHPWGAYAIQTLFFSNLAGHCQNCSEADLQLAAAIGADAASRVLVLDELAEGRFGRPNMSSAAAILSELSPSPRPEGEP